MLRMCVCVRERERETDRQTEIERDSWTARKGERGREKASNR